LHGYKNFSGRVTIKNMKKHNRIFMTITLTALFILCSCTAKAQSSASAEGLASTFAEAGLPLYKEKISIRDFSLPALTGENVSLSALKGKVVFLNFWATWCGPCRAEMPSMEALYQSYKEQGLEILAVNCGEAGPGVLAFMNNNKLSFPVLLDSDGKVSQTYGVQAIPSSFIINREGNIISRVVGSLDWDTPKIRAVFEKLLE